MENDINIATCKEKITQLENYHKLVSDLLHQCIESYYQSVYIHSDYNSVITKGAILNKQISGDKTIQHK